MIDRKAQEAVISKRIGGNMRKWRMEMGITQSDLAERLDVAQQTIQSWEAGRMRISAPTLYIVAHELQTPFILMFADKEAPLD